MTTQEQKQLDRKYFWIGVAKVLLPILTAFSLGYFMNELIIKP